MSLQYRNTKCIDELIKLEGVPKGEKFNFMV